MLKKVKNRIGLALSSLILAAGLLTGCSDAFDVAAGGFNGESGARAVDSGSQPNHYVEVKATSTSGWEQKNKFQFKLSDISIKSGDTVSFQLQTPEGASKLTVRGINGSSESKWIKDVSVSGNKWYSVSATATADATQLGITVYCTAQSGLKVRIGDLKVKDTWIAANTVKGKVKEYYASPKSFSVSTNDSGSSTPTPTPTPKSKIKYVGVRSSNAGEGSGKSGMYQKNGSDWVNAINRINGKFNNTTGTALWIVGTCGGSKDEDCTLNFPRPSGVSSYSHIKYASSDSTKDFIKKASKEKFNVYLQIEPGFADINRLAKIVMRDYLQQLKDEGIDTSCVKGFGLDVEWFERTPKGTSNDQGRKMKVGETVTFIETVLGINSSYKVYLKHYSSKYIPKYSDFASYGEGKTYTDTLILIDDSQDFNSSDSSPTAAEKYDKMVSDFTSWANTYKQYPVYFQIGYEDDEIMWQNTDKDKCVIVRSNPAYTWGNAIEKEIEKKGISVKEIGIIWVDFTLKNMLDHMN